MEPVAELAAPAAAASDMHTSKTTTTYRLLDSARKKYETGPELGLECIGDLCWQGLLVVQLQ